RARGWPAAVPHPAGAAPGDPRAALRSRGAARGGGGEPPALCGPDKGEMLADPLRGRQGRREGGAATLLAPAGGGTAGGDVAPAGHGGRAGDPAAGGGWLARPAAPGAAAGAGGGRGS